MIKEAGFFSVLAFSSVPPPPHAVRNVVDATKTFQYVTAFLILIEFIYYSMKVLSKIFIQSIKLINDYTLR